MAISEISVDELAEQLATGSRLIDVRESDEFDEGHVPGAVHIPLATVPDNVEQFRGAGRDLRDLPVGGQEPARPASSSPIVASRW